MVNQTGLAVIPADAQRRAGIHSPTGRPMDPGSAQARRPG